MEPLCWCFSADFDGPPEAFTALDRSLEGFSGRAGGEKRVELTFKWRVDEPEAITDTEDGVLAELGDELDGTSYYWCAKCRSPRSPSGEQALRTLLTDHL